MTIWPIPPGTLRRPFYSSLVRRISLAIEKGELAPGERLPTHRALAERLGLSVQTVSRAYEELNRRGLVQGEVGRGSFVRSDRGTVSQPFIPERVSGGPIDLSILKPVVGRIHEERTSELLSALSRNLPRAALSSFRPLAALGHCRTPAAAWLRGYGLEVEPERIQITNGVTAALQVALLSVAGAGEVIAAEAVTLHTLKSLANYLGIRIKPLAMDEQGVLPFALEQAARGGAIKAVFLMPSMASPTGIVMNEERRQAVVEIARRHGIYIIEDDAWGPLIEDRLPPLAQFAPELTFYATSFTKCIMPGLRTGYLVSPESMVSAVANRQLVTQWMATPLIAEMAARWIEDGTAMELVRWQRRTLRERNRMAGEILEGLSFRSHPDGLQLWLTLPSAWREEEFVAHVRLQGVAVAASKAFRIDPALPLSAVRICLGSTSAEELRHGLEVVQRLARAEPEPALLTF